MITVEWIPCCAYSPVNNRFKAWNKSDWRKPKKISWDDYKKRYCSYLIQKKRTQKKWWERKKGQLKRYFAVAFCFSSNLIFKKLRNNREEETLSSFNCENTQLTKLRWMEHCFEDDDDDDDKREREKKAAESFLSAFPSIFKCATAVLFIAQVSVSLFSHLNSVYMLRHLSSLFVGQVLYFTSFKASVI